MSEFRKVGAGEAWKSKFPEHVVVATTVDKKGRPNAITLGWMMPTSNQPPMLAISVGLTRYSHQLLEECGEFVVAFPDESAEDQMLFCGSKSGRDFDDKLKACGWETEEAEIVAPPLLKNCVANFECKVAGTLLTGDHTIFAGEIVSAHISKKSQDRLYNFGSGVFKSISSEI